MIGRCLEKIGVHVVDTVDSSGLPTFLPFSPEELLFPRQSQTAGHIRKINDPLANSENWYWKSLWSSHQLVMINLKVTIVRFTAIIRENLDHYLKKTIGYFLIQSLMEFTTGSWQHMGSFFFYDPLLVDMESGRGAVHNRSKRHAEKNFALVLKKTTTTRIVTSLGNGAYLFLFIQSDSFFVFFSFSLIPILLPIAWHTGRLSSSSISGMAAGRIYPAGKNLDKESKKRHRDNIAFQHIYPDRFKSMYLKLIEL